MSKTVVVLLLLLIVNSFLRTNRNIKWSTKENHISYYLNKVEKEKKSKITDNDRSLAILVVMAIDAAIVFFALSEILNAIK